MADKKREKEKSLENAGLAGAQAETVQRYGSAVKEHFVSYSGMDVMELLRCMLNGLLSFNQKTCLSCKA